MRHGCVVGVLVITCLPGIVGDVAAGHMEHGHSSIQLENAWARRTPPMAQQEQGGHGGSTLHPNNSAVYITVRNHGSEPDALLSAATFAATTVGLHETVEKDGIMLMQSRRQFDVPAGASLEMKPGSYHLMLLGVKQALQPGDVVHVTLTFQKAGEMSVDAPVN
jgi:copper(I)-binding protein